MWKSNTETSQHYWFEKSEDLLLKAAKPDSTRKICCQKALLVKVTFDVDFRWAKVSFDWFLPIHFIRYRSSHQRCSIRKNVLRNFTKFTGKHLRQSLWHMCFPVNFMKFLKTSFLQNICGRLLLMINLWKYHWILAGQILQESLSYRIRNCLKTYLLISTKREVNKLFAFLVISRVDCNLSSQNW